MVENNKIRNQTEEQIRDLGENEFRAFVFALQEQVAALLEENDGLKARVKTLEGQINKHEENHKRNEMDRIKNSVIIKNLPYHKDAKDGHETRKQTQEVITKLLATMEAGTEVGVTDSLRFGQNADHADKPGLVRLTVSTSKQKAKIYEALTKASKKSSYKKTYAKISVNDEIPAYLRQKQIKLEKQAYEIRKKDKTMRTRVFLKGTDIVLKIKGKTDNYFREWESSESEEEEFFSDEETFQSSQNTQSKATKKKAATMSRGGKASTSRGRGAARS